MNVPDRVTFQVNPTLCVLQLLDKFGLTEQQTSSYGGNSPDTIVVWRPIEIIKPIPWWKKSVARHDYFMINEKYEQTVSRSFVKAARHRCFAFDTISKKLTVLGREYLEDAVNISERIVEIYDADVEIYLASEKPFVSIETSLDQVNKCKKWLEG